jgi:hypothetical protein
VQEQNTENMVIAQQQDAETGVAVSNSRATAIAHGIFVVLIMAALCVPAVSYVVQKSGIDLPPWVTTEDITHLSGASTDVNVSSKANWADVVAGTFQTAAQKEVGNFVPGKAAATLANAALQRSAIAASNVLFDWPCYPTYFGASRIYIPAQNALSYMPPKDVENLQQGWAAFANALVEAARQLPDVQFVFYAAGGYDLPAVNPAYDLVTNSVNYDDFYSAMNSVILESGLTNIQVLKSEYNNLDDYYQDFFRTDHHWNIKGALAAYAQICEALDLPVNDFGDYVTLQNYKFSGATARWGLDLIDEEVFDLEDQFDYLLINGFLSGSDRSAFWDYPERYKKYAYYDKTYDSLGKCNITGGNGADNVLLLSNSYKGALQRPLAFSAANLKVSDALHPAAYQSLANDGGLVNLVESGNTSKVVIVGTSADTATFGCKHSDLLE